MERRSFLKGILGVAGAAVAAEGCSKLEALSSSRIEQRTSHIYPARETGPAELSEPHERFEWGPPRRMTPEQNERINNFWRELSQFSRAIRREYFNQGASSFVNASLETQRRVRSMFLASSLKRTFDELGDELLLSQDRSLYSMALDTFSECSSHGLLYAKIKECAERLELPLPIAHNDIYYRARVRDYLPSGTDIWSHDIDPRNNPGLTGTDLAELQAHPGWAGSYRKAAFRQLASNEEIQRLAKQADLTVVEYFSLLKATQHVFVDRAWQTPEDQSAPRIEAIAQQLLTQREAFAHTNLADRTTQQAILFYGRDRENVHQGSDEHAWSEILGSAGVPEERIREFGTTREHNAEDIRTRLLSAIEHSSGKTFIAFDTHGNPTVLAVDMERPDHVTTQNLAQALVARLERLAQPTGLREITLVLEACYTFNFGQNLMTSIREQWDAQPNRPFPSSQIELPTLLTAVQEDSMGFHNFKMISLLSEQLNGIQQDGGLSGQRILQVVQPKSYIHNDITCFAPGSGTEFARRRQPRNEAEPV